MMQTETLRSLGSVALDHYFTRLSAMIDPTLGDKSRWRADELRAFFSTLLGAADWRQGCLISDLVTEAARWRSIARGLDEALRLQRRH